MLKAPMKAAGNALLLLLLGAGHNLQAADDVVNECLLLQAVDGTLDYISDETECDVATAPASTFKLPHALIALETGVITDPLANVPWDGTDYANDSWKREHSMDSAIKWSALWFFQRTATLIGRERMLAGIVKLEYAADSYEGAQSQFWLNGDLVVTPYEQLRFLRRLARNELPVSPEHRSALNAAFLMPTGKVTMAAGEPDFVLRWPELMSVHAKTGNARVNGEAVSWLVGYFDANGTRYVFAARARSGGSLPATAGADLAARALNAQADLLPRK
jgi:beta-lactamase class D